MAEARGVAIKQISTDDDDDDVGPMPLPAGVALYEKDGVEEFLEREERRRKNIEVRAWLSL